MIISHGITFMVRCFKPCVVHLFSVHSYNFVLNRFPIDLRMLKGKMKEEATSPGELGEGRRNEMRRRRAHAGGA